VNGLRTDISQAHQQRQTAFAGYVEATEELHTRHRELETATEQLMQLTQQVGRYTALLENNNIDPATPADGIAPRVAGEVLQVRQGDILLSIGTDDGLRSGQTLQVWRANRYLGQARVVSTEPDRAVAEMDRNNQLGVVEVGDRVATRF
jgi:hypothetical protein